MDSDYDKETRERTFRSLLTDEDAACFEKLDRLEFFCFGGTDIGDAGFKSIANGFKSIANMKRLTTLQLSGPTRLTDQAFAAFSSGSPVWSIRIHSGHFSGEGLEHLAKLDELRT
jgi:hypothetical protein